MLLSDAIRLGAMLYPQGHHHMHDYQWNNDRGEFAPVASCALGAAEDAGYVLAPSLDRRKEWTCPACLGYGNLHGMIVHLNDVHRWTRERIADWVATVEPREVQEAITSEPHEALV